MQWRIHGEPKQGFGGGTPSGVRGRSKLKAFCTFLYEKVAKS